MSHLWKIASWRKERLNAPPVSGGSPEARRFMAHSLAMGTVGPSCRKLPRTRPKASVMVRFIAKCRDRFSVEFLCIDVEE